MGERKSSKLKILEAASELARTKGAAHLSLDAVAARAGVSKGGLLYNYPTKSALLKALVQNHIELFEAALDQRLTTLPPSSLPAEYLRLMVEEMDKMPPPSGLLAALAENPEMLEPIRAFHRVLLDRMKSASADEPAVFMLFMVLEGLRCQKMLGTEILSQEERALLLDRLGAMLN